MFLNSWQPGGSGFTAHACRATLSLEHLCATDREGFHGRTICGENPLAGCVGELTLDNLADLRAAFAQPASGSLAALLLTLFERRGDDAFDAIDGEFALAIWDKRSDCLTLARDALGRRPLYFAKRDERVFFGSSAIEVAMAAGPAGIDFEELINFLLQRAGAGSRSFLTGVSRLPPGTSHRFGPSGDGHSTSWWRPDLSPIDLPDAELLEALKDELDRSVTNILRGRRKIAAHLSAGLDSSLTAVTISAQLPAGARVAALCASPAGRVEPNDNPGMSDEFPVAQQTAQMLGNVDMFRVKSNDDDWLSASDRFSTAASMPYRNPANLPWLGATYSMAKSLGADVVVESNQGNLTYSWTGSGAVSSLIRNHRWKALAGLIKTIRRDHLGSGVMVIPHALFGLLPSAIADPLAALAGAESAEATAFLRSDHPAVRRALRQVRDSGQWLRVERPVRNVSERLLQLNWADHGSHCLAAETLFGIPLSDPFSARRLVELTLRIDDTRFVHDGKGRGFARQLLHGKVPDQVSAGNIIWQQGIDWRVGALKRRDTVLADFDYADRDPALSGLLDIGRLREAVAGWTRGADDLKSLAKSGSVMRAIGAIRFVRSVSTLAKAG